ncbi:MAG: hypothetical protein R6W67_05440, partial [Bacteroidales bacterium]
MSLTNISKKLDTMQITGFRSNYLPHIINITLFLLISVVYFYPVLEGKKLKTNDNTVYISSAREINDHREKYGEEPLWTNSMFSGMPAYLISTLYPGNLIEKIDRTLKIFKIPVAAIFLTMVGFYVLLLFYGLNPWIAGAGAIAYSLSSYLFIILGAGHNTKAFAIAYMAPLIGSIVYSYRRNAVAGAIFLAWFLSLELIANHIQITYYALLAVALFGATELIFSIREKRILQFMKTTGILIIPVIIAVSVNFGNMLTTYEYSKYSMRGKSELEMPRGKKTDGLDINYATQWSYGIDETMTLLIPGFKGGASKPFSNDSRTYKALRQNNSLEYISGLPKYWGTQPGTDGPVYVGAIVFFLFVLGLFILKGPDKWWLLAATILSLLLAWGKNLLWFTEFFMNVVPGYNKFRAVSMTLVIAEFCIPLIGFLALDSIITGRVTASEIIKGLKRATIVIGGLLMLFILFPGISGSFLSPYEQGGQLPAWLSSAMIADRKELVRADAFRSLVFALMAASMIYFFIKDKLKLKMLIPALIILILADMWPVNKRYMNNDKFVHASQFNRSFSPTRADEAIIADPGINRVLNLSVSTFNDATTSYYHHSVGGYHGAKLRRYQELIDSVMVRELSAFTGALSAARTEADIEPAMASLSSLNMLNTKYIIYNPEAAPLINPYALGNAWFAKKITWVQSSNEELRLLPLIGSHEALIKEQFREHVNIIEIPEQKDEEAIYLTSYKANELIYKSSASSDRVALFSEIYYPAGWKAYIDGRQVEHFRANYIL